MQHIVNEFGDGEGSTAYARELAKAQGVPIIVGSQEEAEDLARCGYVTCYIKKVCTLDLQPGVIFDPSAVARLASDLLVAQEQLESMHRAIEALHEVVESHRSSAV